MRLPFTMPALRPKVTLLPSPVEGKRILFINAGSRKKRVTFEEALRLGLSITLVHPGSHSYADAYCDNMIDTTGKPPAEALREIELLHQEKPFDGVITFLEEDVEFAAEVAERLHLIGISNETASVARNKYKMRETLRNAGVPVPVARLVATMTEAKAAAEAVGYPLVMKPFKGTDSMWVMKIQNEPELLRAFADMAKYAKHPYEAVVAVETKKYVIEEYMSGSEVSVEALAQNGKVSVIGIIDKLPMAEPYFIERGDVCPSRHPEKMQERIREVAAATVRAIGMDNGVAHVEIKITETGPKIIEVAARMGGDYICDWMETIYNVNLARQAILIALGSPMDMKPKPAQICLRGEYFIPEEDSILRDVCGLQEVQKINQSPNVHHLYIWSHKGDTLLTPPRGFATAGWLVVSGKTAAEVDKNMAELRRLVHIRFEPLSAQKGERTDIIQLSLRQYIARPREKEAARLRFFTELPEAKSLWEQFAHADNPFQDWEFRSAFARGYGGELSFLAAEAEDSTTVGFLPLQYVSERKRWEFFGTSWFEENTFFTRSEAVLRQMLHAAPRPLCLNDIALTELRRFQSLPLDFDEEKFTLDLTKYKTADDALEQLSSHRNSTIRRKLRKMDELHPTVSTEVWPAAIEAMIELNQKRFGAEHSFTAARAQAFKELFAAPLGRLKQRVLTLRVGDAIAGIRFSLYNSDRYIGLNAGWNVEKFPFVGAALTAASITDAIALGCPIYDALANDYGWKLYWGFQPQPMYYLAIEDVDNGK